jgi:hypothetical protein
MQWSVSSIYYLRSTDFRPLVIGAGVATGAYLVLLLLLPRREPARIGGNARLERGL